MFTRDHSSLPLMLALAAVALAVPAYAQSDTGTTSKYPFSTYWYPHAEGGLTGPLGKYDQVHNTQAAGWEQANHVNAEGVQPWFGHCHAFSAAACTEEEPTEPLDYKGVNFAVGDLKGLLVALHAQDEATNYGDRYGDGNGDDPADIPPDEVWRLCQTYIKQRGIPLIFDMEGGEEVWNFPCYQYEVSYQDEGGGWVAGTMQLVVADDDVDPDYVGTQPSVYSYTFRCKMQGGSIVAGSGQWTGENATDHPDFAWYPYVARAENPDVDPEKVKQILGKEVGGGGNPPDEQENRRPDNLEPPRDPDGAGPQPPENVRPPEGLESPPLEGGSAVRPGPVVEFDQILSPIETVSLISNKTSHFGLDMFVDRNDGGKYRPGEPIGISLESKQEGYLYLFDIDPAGNLSLVFPRAGEGNFIPAGKLIDIPPGDVKPWHIAQAPGEHHLRALVTTTPLAITGFHTLPQKKLQEKGKGKATRATPQKMRVPPTTYNRVKKRLTGYYSSKSIEYKPPTKVKGFAQDDCMYFVVGE